MHNEVPRLHDCHLRLPKSFADKAARLAKEDGESLNPWIVSAVAQKFGAALTAENFPKARSGTSIPGDLTKLSTVCQCAACAGACYPRLG